MPIDYKNYPPEWHELSRRIRFERAGGRCECDGECGRDHGGRCERRQGDELKPPATVVLTVAHLWRGPCAPCHAEKVKCGVDSHLKAMCQGCHLIYDLPHHVFNARRTRARKAGQMWLADIEQAA